MIEHDDGITVTYSPENLDEVMKYCAKGDATTLSEYREIALALLAEQIPADAADAAQDLRHALHYLRWAERGEFKDPRTAFELGAEFGMALERLRCWLAASIVGRHRKWERGKNEGAKTKKKEAAERREYYRREFQRLREEDPDATADELYELTASLIQKQTGFKTPSARTIRRAVTGK